MVAAKKVSGLKTSVYKKTETVQTHLLLRQLSTYDPRIAELNVRKKQKRRSVGR